MALACPHPADEGGGVTARPPARPQVLEMLILVLQQCHKESEDRWKRLSRQVADILLPMLAKQQVRRGGGRDVASFTLGSIAHSSVCAGPGTGASIPLLSEPLPL